MQAKSAILIAFLAASVTAAVCRADVRIEAFRGEPFGVGRVTIDLPQDKSTAPGGDDRFAVTDDEGRVVYPVLEQRRIGKLLRDFLGIDLPGRATFYFLFRGDEPLKLTVYAPAAQHFTVTPEQRDDRFRRRFDEWWKTYTARYDQVAHDAEYPVEIENYLTANWARRLGRDMPEPNLQLFGQRKIGDSWIAQLTANESYQALVERDLVLGRFGDGQAASVDLPGEPASAGGLTTITNATSPAKPVDVEPLATHVPRECFYERFGNFNNYLWYRDFLHHWQNDLGNMVTLRSINHASRDRLQDQLAVHESQVGRVMGPKVIRDVCFMGFDYYMRDGAALGIMFQANNNLLLGQNFNSERSKAVASHPGAKLETVSIAGHDVSYLSTPDGRLRSYYAVDGDFHLITTCRRLVERFYAAPSDGTSLAASAEFQNTRAQMPLTRDDTIFLYLSSPFLDHLASPAYRVELDRRLRSIGEIRRARARPHDRQGRRLERQFRRRTRRGEVPAARLRAARLTAASSSLTKTAITIRSAASPAGSCPWPTCRSTRSRLPKRSIFRRSRNRSIAEVGRFVPVVAAVQRSVSDDGKLDRIAGEVHIAPYSQTKIEKWAHMLGPAEANRVAPIKGDVASLELVLDALGQSVHVFGGLRDFNTPLVVRQGEARPAASPTEFIRGYIGTWPRPLALLDGFLGRPTGPPDAQGVSPNNNLFNLWQRRVNDFFLFSFHRDVLLEVGPQLAMIEAERPAQIRLHIDDLSDKQIATGVNGLGYMRMRDASASGSRFMNSLTSELHVPAEKAREIAERLVDGRFVDPLGGDYSLVDASSDRKLWASTATSPANKFLLTEIPADYTMPLMQWFRGLTLEVARDDGADTLSARANLDMVHIDVTPPAEAGEGPSFLGGLLGGWGSTKNDDAKPSQSKDALPSPK